MYLDERGYLVLETIVNNPSITGKEIEASLKLSRKQLSYTIDKINDYLIDNELPKIERLRTGKFIVSAAVLDEYQTEDVAKTDVVYVYSENERGCLIFLLLLCSKENLSIYHFTSKLDISKNTFLTDLKKVEARIEIYGLDILYSRQDGYHLVGSEYAKRDAMIDMIRSVLKMPKGREVLLDICEIEESQLDTVKEQISHIEERLQIRFTDERLNELPYILSLVLIRISKNRIIRELPEEFQHVAGTKEYSVMVEFAKTYDIDYPTERLFLAAQIQISNFHGMASEDTNQEELMNAAKQVIQNFEKVACITFKEKEALLEALLQHVKPAVYRIKYHYHIEQSIKDMVLPQYNTLHMMVRKSVKPFEEYLSSPFPDEELVYITALFGAWLRREGIMDIVDTRKRAVVVCANGVSVSNFLFFTLRELFPEIDFIQCLSMREFSDFKEKFDIVFSMVRLETSKIQFLVKPFLDDNSKRKFREKVLSEVNGVTPHQLQVSDIVSIVEKHTQITDREGLIRDIRRAMGVTQNSEPIDRFMDRGKSVELKDILVEETIQVSKKVLPWEEAIRLTAKPLIEREDIEQQYVECSIDNIKRDKPFIMVADGVIIAHAGVNDGVNRVCISMLTLPERINVNDYMEADVVIMLGTPNATKHLRMLSQMNEILEDETKLTQVKMAETPKEIITIIQEEKEN